MTEQEKLLLEQQQQAIPQLAPAKSYALGQNPGNYAEGQRVADAYTKYQSALAQKPADYVSPYQGQIDAAYQKILNRQPFKYDVNADMLYQQYKDQYTMQGKKAMQDAMGNASAMTGGYDNSYAQTVGQQTNQAYMQQITDKLPEFSDRAYGKYRDEGQDEITRLGLSQGMDDRSYGKYRDTVGDWNNDVNRENSNYTTERGFDIDMYRDAVSSFQNQRDYDFNQEQFAYEKSWNQTQFDYQKSQDAQAYALAASKSSGGSSSGSRGKGGTSPQFTAEEIALFEQMLEDEKKKKQAEYIKQYVSTSKSQRGGM